MSEDAAALSYLVQRMQLDAAHDGFTGCSSDAMVLSCFTGEETIRWDYPRDRGDWRRCLLAYALAPEFLRERMRPTMRLYRESLDRRYWRWSSVKSPSPSRLSQVTS